MGNACASSLGQNENKRRSLSGQVAMEFTFAIFIVFLFVYAFIKVFAWSGVSLAERGQVHQKSLTQPIMESYNTLGLQSQGPLKQVDPYFYKTKNMRAVWGE